MITLKDIKENKDISEYIRRADCSLIALGYTEHSFAHVGKVVSATEYIMQTLGFSDHDIELAKIAAYMHDIGNLAHGFAHLTEREFTTFVVTNFEFKRFNKLTT